MNDGGVNTHGHGQGVVYGKIIGIVIGLVSKVVDMVLPMGAARAHGHCHGHRHGYGHSRGAMDLDSVATWIPESLEGTFETVGPSRLSGLQSSGL